jgi:hypothetical protein
MDARANFFLSTNIEDRLANIDGVITSGPLEAALSRYG